MLPGNGEKHGNTETWPGGTKPGRGGQEKTTFYPADCLAWANCGRDGGWSKSEKLSKALGRKVTTGGQRLG